MRLIFVDNAGWRNKLLPLTFLRPVSALRIGILTIEEKWSKYLSADFTHLSEDYLSRKFPLELGEEQAYLFIRGNVCPSHPLLAQIHDLKVGQGLKDENGWVVMKVDRAMVHPCLHALSSSSLRNESSLSSLRNESSFLNPLIQWIEIEKLALSIRYPEDLFLNNGQEIWHDYALLTAGRTSAPISKTNQILGDQIFAEEGVQVECSVLNSLQGPIYLGRQAEIWENCAIRGPFALCEGAQVKMGAKVYSNVTVGPYSRVGGELNTCVILGYSSKGHDGYLGSAVMGEWCNWGADTNNSNLKNNYKSVKVYDYELSDYRQTNQQFYGVIMGDHAKCAINTSFNTGSVVGVGASVFGAGFPPTYIPDFSWGGAHGMDEYDLESFFETAALVYERRNRIFGEEDKDILRWVFEQTKDLRKK
jgi:UDP-N-acetylglucosamine diphosphorylase/glucosamine-1-phosphate N-acetyltransferase